MLRPTHLGLFAVALQLLAILGALIAPLDTPPQTPAAWVPPVNKHQSLDHRQVVGFSLNVHYTEQLPKYLRAIDMVADMGCNSLQVLTPAFQVDGSSTHITMPNRPGRCPETPQLLKILKYAQSRQLKTLLMPTILFTKPRGNEWRGKISPDNWDAWWDSYSVTMRHFANLAQRAKVDVLCVGSELLSTEMQTHRWVKLIAEIRNVYHGQLLYATNWDHYHVPGFWDRLDYVGISGYWNLTSDTIDPDTHYKSDEQLQQQLGKRWQTIQTSLSDFARDIHKPILITELGYPCLPWGLKDPWNYVPDGKAPVTPQIQAIGYQSFCDSWGQLIRPYAPTPANGFAGVIFYTWDPYNGGPTDPGYGVWGKPAQPIIRKWLHRNPVN
ncbi:MAG TPA: hypothetical protein DCM28_11850 [Phycisphaerales bacterium]|nr:hypothetical protein [Phycisphaerales bacterium]|tara:strand:- start:62999 stop:64147 length:1149 start_codon:yes stop_codon:yes gene_type:complete